MEKLSLDYILESEESFAVNNYDGDITAPVYTFIPGDIPIIITSTHPVRTLRLRNGVLSVGFLEKITGAITKIIPNLLYNGRPHIMYRNNFNNKEEMFNNKFYNEELANYVLDNQVLFVLDIHGASLKREFDVAPGTNNYAFIGYDMRFKEELNASLNQFGIYDINYNTKFDAKNERTISRHMYDLGIKNYGYNPELGLFLKTMQLEIQGTFRRPSDNIENLEKTRAIILGLKTYIENIQDHVIDQSKKLELR